MYTLKQMEEMGATISKNNDGSLVVDLTNVVKQNVANALDAISGMAPEQIARYENVLLKVATRLSPATSCAQVQKSYPLD